MSVRVYSPHQKLRGSFGRFVVRKAIAPFERFVLNVERMVRMVGWE